MAEPFVYEGRIKSFDPEPGIEIYLIDHPKAEGDWGLSLADEIERWADEQIFARVSGRRYRITVEEITDAPH